MRALARPMTLLATAVLIAGTVRAQTCVGNSALEHAKMNIAGVAKFGDHWKSYGGELNSALTRWAYLGLGASSTTFDGFSDKQLDAKASLGIEISAGNVSVCPIGFGGYSKVTGADGESSYGGGLGAGLTVNPGSSFALIPFGGLMYSRPTKTDLCGSDCGNTDIFAGLGLRFGGGIQLSPQFSKSTRSGSKAVYGVSLSFLFGKT